MGIHRSEPFGPFKRQCNIVQKYDQKEDQQGMRRSMNATPTRPSNNN
jgi:hypothetical protein